MFMSRTALPQPPALAYGARTIHRHPPKAGLGPDNCKRGRRPLPDFVPLCQGEIITDPTSSFGTGAATPWRP